MDQWLKNYARCRYGADSKKALEGLNIAYKTTYSVPILKPGDYPYNSAVCGRPGMHRAMKARQFTTIVKPYDEWELAEAWLKMIQAAPACAASDGYRFDLVDLGRQVLNGLRHTLSLRYIRCVESERCEGRSFVQQKNVAVDCGYGSLAGHT